MKKEGEEGVKKKRRRQGRKKGVRKRLIRIYAFSNIIDLNVLELKITGAHACRPKVARHRYCIG